MSVQSWVTEMAAYVKSLDPNHLLTVGEEGFYTSTANKTYCNPSSSARASSQSPLSHAHLDLRFATLTHLSPLCPCPCPCSFTMHITSVIQENNDKREHHLVFAKQRQILDLLWVQRGGSAGFPRPARTPLLTIPPQTLTLWPSTPGSTTGSQG